MSSFDLPRYFATELDEHLAVAGQTKAALAREFGRLVDVCAKSLSSGGKLLFFGNGVSEEFLALHRAGVFTAAELDQIRLNGLSDPF